VEGGVVSEKIPGGGRRLTFCAVLGGWEEVGMFLFNATATYRMRSDRTPSRSHLFFFCCDANGGISRGTRIQRLSFIAAQRGGMALA